MPSPQTSHCSRPRRLPHPACSTASRSRHVQRARQRRRSRHIQRARQRRPELRPCSTPASPVTVLSRPASPPQESQRVQRRVASHRELVRRKCCVPSMTVTANFPTVRVHADATSPSVLDSVASPVYIQAAHRGRSPRPASPATTVLPVSPATVNLFDEIASDPSDAVTANFPLFTSTSPATSSVLDSVAAPVTFNARQRRRSRHIQRARQRRELRLLNALPSRPASPPPPCCPCCQPP